MLRQYFTSPYQGGDNPLRVGTIAVGTIFYLQNDGFFRHRHIIGPTCRSPWIVEAFLNGVVCAGRRNKLSGRWEDLYVKGRSDQAIMRSLRDNRRKTVVVRLLEAHSALGLTRGGDRYPDLPPASLVERLLGGAVPSEGSCRQAAPALPVSPLSLDHLHGGRHAQEEESSSAEEERRRHDPVRRIDWRARTSCGHRS